MYGFNSLENNHDRKDHVKNSVIIFYFPTKFYIDFYKGCLGEDL